MLSVIATNYNKEDMLPDFFNSIYSNGFDNFELIFIDDCSTDSSVEIARRFPCRIIQNEQNLGPAVSRNLASRQAKGNVLVFTDTDITIDPGGLELINRRFSEDKVKAMFGKLAFLPLRNTRIGRFWLYDEEEVCHYGGVKTGMVNCWSSTLGVVDRDLYLNIGGFDESFKGADIEDHELAAKILDHYPVFYDEELTFHHYYPSTKLVLKKMFVRSRMFARSTSIKVYKERSWVSPHRNVSFLLSAIITALITAVPVSFFFVPPVAWWITGLLLTAILTKSIHHRLLFNAVLENETLVFGVYCFFMLYLTSLFAMAGFAAGLLSGKKSTHG
ncbi:MAG: glycosyltransferase family 2 protein [Candidatus Sabulitectum sp.]|nr:glycosyltransferase family 2 protein [Candidatus Sabulitectum sp.]